MSTYILPSSLANLLRIHGTDKRQEGPVSTDSEKPGPKKSTRRSLISTPRRLQLREWGTVDFDDADGPMSFPGSASRALSARSRSPVPGSDAGEQSVDKWQVKPIIQPC